MMAHAARRNFPKPLAPARFKGWQERPSGRAPIELWNLTHDIPGHPAGSTVTRETIEKAGLYLPDPPEPARNPGEPPDLSKGWIEPAREDERQDGAYRLCFETGERFALSTLDAIRAQKEGVPFQPKKPGRYWTGRRNPDEAARRRKATDYIQAIKGQAGRAFAVAYALHLAKATPPAPSHRAFHVDAQEAQTIRRDLAAILEAPFPNPSPRGATKRRKRHAANPPRGRTLIYTGGRIRGTWYGRHRNGKLYKHKFGGGSKAVYGLPDGSIQIVPEKGRLWGMH